jgi:hypothetical protein
MNRELIGAWLNIPTDPWPPDHYTLLGLNQGETDRTRIEQHVQERLEQVRRFQLAHPEPATEAMNRLAQAFVGLTDGRAKPVDAVPLATATAAPLQLDWRAAPPPQRGAAAPADTVVPLAVETATLPEIVPLEEEAAARPAPPVDLDDRFRAALPRGFATRRAVLEQVLLTRRMLAAWRGAGAYLTRETRPLSKPAEATDLIQRMQQVRGLLGAFAGFLGEAGEPGYLVAALARQAFIVPTLHDLQPSQRAALSRDWQTGLDLLIARLNFLRRELRGLRERDGWSRTIRSILLTLRDHPGWILLALGLAALNFIPAFRARLIEQLVLLLGLLAFRLFVWWDERDSFRRYHTAARRKSAPSSKKRDLRPARELRP